MKLPYYRLPLAFAASLSLSVAGCGSKQADQAAAPPPPAAPQAQSAAAASGDIDTDSTIWTFLGLASKPSQSPTGPQTGPEVSPVLWEATHDTLNFVKTSAEDPDTGVIQTEWYSPRNKPDERLRVTVFILSRALRSDSVAVTIDRQVRSPGGPWQPSTVSNEVGADLETAILLRARQIHADRYANRMYKK